MPLESYATLLNDARQRSYAVGAFNIFALEFLPVILQAAEEERSPALLQINPIHYPLADLDAYLVYVKQQIQTVSVPVGLNLDHGTDETVLFRGIRAGFPSVMFDGSKLPYDENLRRTRDISAVCSRSGVTLEAELGTLNDEGLELTAENRRKLFTDATVAAEFVQQTGVDGLAVAIGNAHGFYKGTPQLDFDLLQDIAGRVPVPLVLHGGSGITNEDFKRAIRLGINKINIYTEMSAAAAATVKTHTAKQEAPVDYPTLLLQARLAVKAVVKTKMQVFGSSGKA
jgi:fructose-bisphosphate aldolase class II